MSAIHLQEKLVRFIEDFPGRAKFYSKTLGVVLGVGLLTGFAARSPWHQRVPVYPVGSIARTNIKAPHALKAIDEEVTERKKLQAADTVPDVYEFDSQALRTRQLEVANRLFKTASKKEIEESLAVKFSMPEWKLISENPKFRETSRSIQNIFHSLADLWLVSESEAPQKAEFTVRDVRTGDEKKIVAGSNSKRLVNVEDLRNFIFNDARAKSSLPPRLNSEERKLFVSIVAKLVEPNLVFNRVETKARQDEAKFKVESSWVEVAEGEMIIREGQRVDRKDHLLLQVFSESDSSNSGLAAHLQFAALVSALIVIFYQVGQRNFRKFKLSFKDQWVLGGFFLVSLSFVSILFYLVYAAKDQTTDSTLFYLIIPTAFAAMTLRLFNSMEITLFFALLQAVAMTWLTRDPYFSLTIFASSLAGAARMRHITQRLDVFTAGFAAGVVQAIMMTLGLGTRSITLFPIELSWLHVLEIVFYSLGSGVLSSMMVLGTQPLLEYLGYTTDLRLMELSSTNHPLLKEMIIKAPGTYFHSFSVSQLAEKAAEAIHANVLFARVASLYHDIGKIKKPHYFIENIKGENKHDKLVPSMSALIISNHVKDGIELGFEHQLPLSIVEIIPQHHGTSLISYFYDKALKSTGEGEVIDPREYRYPGPKPQTREGAIILLADAAEATAKSLQVKNPENLRHCVHSTIQRFYLDGQLDECDLTLKDLTAIGNAFLQVLQGMYHSRIDYPHLRESQIRKAGPLNFDPVEGIAGQESPNPVKS